eukprot:Colp12_sorted_trinity150504_noHs@16626
MARLYDAAEPTVIDDTLLLKAISEQATGETAEMLKRDKDSVDYADIKSLRLDFKNILKIDNLWGFQNLTKLQLDNNVIEKIENLDSLVNLEWLDLSFNNIEVIEGLDKLTKLTDLTLFNNRITTLQNMDALTQLNVLSIGNNQLAQIENLVYLRKFSNLRCLTLRDNPFCKTTDYASYAIAHLPLLHYLDYTLIQATDRA